MSLEHFRDPLREFVPAQFRPINFFAERRDGLACREPTGSIRPVAAHDRATSVVELLQSFPLSLRGFGLRRVHHLLLAAAYAAFLVAVKVGLSLTGVWVKSILYVTRVLHPSPFSSSARL